MPTPKTPESSSGKPASQPVAKTAGRKPWKKKTPVEVVLEQEEKLRSEIAELEEDIKQKKTQLKKFEEARRIFQST